MENICQIWTRICSTSVVTIITPSFCVNNDLIYNFALLHVLLPYNSFQNLLFKYWYIPETRDLSRTNTMHMNNKLSIFMPLKPLSILNFGIFLFQNKLYNFYSINWLLLLTPTNSWRSGIVIVNTIIFFKTYQRNQAFQMHVLSIQLFISGLRIKPM